MNSVARCCLLMAVVCADNTFAAKSITKLTAEVTVAAASGAQVQLGDKTLRVEVADTAKKRTRGLSGSALLAGDQGMLFVFPGDGRPSIWMKEMRFSLDILWINRFGKIVHIERRVHPDTYPRAFTPREPARYVLEVLAGVAEKVTVGDLVRFKNIPAHRIIQ